MMPCSTKKDEPNRRTARAVRKVECTDWNRRVLLQACLVLGNHFRDRAHHPTRRGSQVMLEYLVRVGVQIVNPGDAQRLDRSLRPASEEITLVHAIDGPVLGYLGPGKPFIP
jgi:hypothetical protein